MKQTKGQIAAIITVMMLLLTLSFPAGAVAQMDMDDSTKVATDSIAAGTEHPQGIGLPTKSTYVSSVPIITPDKTFSDLSGSDNVAAIEALASRGIVDGKGNGLYEPDIPITRAELSAMIVRALGMELVAEGGEAYPFSDVEYGKWYFDFIYTANYFEVITGIGNNLFVPEGTVTRQEAATIVARAAVLCGMDTSMKDDAVQGTLARFSDTAKVEDWSRSAMAFCYSNGILDDSVLEISPAATLTRGEAAQLLLNLLKSANLLSVSLESVAQPDAVRSATVSAEDLAYSTEQGMTISPDTGKDQYMTSPVPKGKPVPVEPQDVVVSDKALTCTLSIRCDTVLNVLDLLTEEKRALVPADGIIFSAEEVTFYEGESVFNVLQREMKISKIHLAFSHTPMYNSAYIEGINQLFEFDAGALSGWMYSVNDWFPNYGCSRYQLQDGDVIEWVYTCALGQDVRGAEPTAG